MTIERIRFVETITVKDREGRIFEAGEEYSLPASSARRWIIRGKAEPVTAKDVEPLQKDSPDSFQTPEPKAKGRQKKAAG